MSIETEGHRELVMTQPIDDDYVDNLEAWYANGGDWVYGGCGDGI